MECLSTSVKKSIILGGLYEVNQSNMLESDKDWCGGGGKIIYLNENLKCLLHAPACVHPQSFLLTTLQQV